MGQYASIFITPANKAVSKNTHPRKPNWITAHAIASELSIAEVERLWVRFQQLGCNPDGELTDSTIMKADYSQDVFMKNILKKYMEGNTKKVTFENFLRALKWVEQSTIDEKIRAMYHFLGNGQPLTPDLMVKILERVYPQDKGEPIKKIVEILFQVMDTDGKKALDEEKFLRGVRKIPPQVLDQYLTFQILPDEMKERLHKNLQEFRSESQIAGPSNAPQNRTPMNARRAKQVVPDQACREVSEKIFKKDWLRVANKLGFFTQDVQEIQSAYPNNAQHQVYQMLKQWKERDGDEATLEVLEKALADCGMHDAAIILTSY
ncbi:hypothetical protein MAR_030017 [Mya arenaria]|uniref:Death domain-containing protein n=2 Tax=Mya arenaria TaxID=6604 RepID=A0ABY7DI67_MYAAR|nr:uncharacterized protein LOC128220136 isoform X2 [Mya arenaria]XP_052784387.1 uncharacterized protein LOC128220136 isoform X2 [Mya arenaria]XP_052784394.1 uncharacterized protein LOC128220136 isoform X2 [Mya arenaria]WAQ97327.1 hypothetical protein MAR_030017 [Mya arenaria]